MRWYQLEPDWEVVAEVGHSDRVTCLHVDVERGVVCSGGEDGFVWVRSITTGLAVLPPLHTGAVHAMASLPDAPERLLVFTRSGVFGLDLDGGGFVALEELGAAEGAPEGRAAATAADAIIVGDGGGTVWRITAGGGPRRLVELHDPVVALTVGGPDGDVVVVGTSTGQIVALEPQTGAIRWRNIHTPGEVLALAASASSVAIAGAGPALRSGKVTVRSLLDGSIEHVADHAHPVEAITVADGRFVVTTGEVADAATGDGDHDATGAIPSTVSAVTVDASGTCWWGTETGDVGRTDDAPLASRSSGVIAAALREDEDELATVDGRNLVRWSPRSGERLATFAAPAAIAVGYAGLDPVVGLADGRLVRVDATTGAVQREADTSCGRLQALGSFGGLVVAIGTEGFEVFHEETLEPATGAASLPAGAAAGIALVGRDGAWFESHGIVAGWRFLFVAGEYVAAVRPGVFGAAEGAVQAGLVRVWDGERFLDTALVAAT